MRFMNTIKLAALPIVAGLALSGCETIPQAECELAQTRNLSLAIDSAKDRLAKGCEVHYHQYLDTLLTIAEGDPKPENKREFSDFLVWSADTGMLSQRQAQALWNRYFNVKFVSLAGDYNNCAMTCPNKAEVLDEMEDELMDKERGLLRATVDQEAYYRADRLYQETELVLEATCQACAAGRR